MTKSVFRVEAKEGSYGPFAPPVDEPLPRRFSVPLRLLVGNDWNIWTLVEDASSLKNPRHNKKLADTKLEMTNIESIVLYRNWNTSQIFQWASVSHQWYHQLHRSQRPLSPATYHQVENWISQFLQVPYSYAGHSFFISLSLLEGKKTIHGEDWLTWRALTPRWDKCGSSCRSITPAMFFPAAVTWNIHKKGGVSISFFRGICLLHNSERNKCTTTLWTIPLFSLWPM